MNVCSYDLICSFSVLASAGGGGGSADSGPPIQMVAFGLVILAAHLGGKLCQQLRLSQVTGQLLGGALVGPYVLRLIGVLSEPTLSLYSDAIHAFRFFVFLFLSLVAFGIGEELHSSRLKKVGRPALIICFVQAGITWLLISSSFYFIGNVDLLMSLLIGSIGVATAPAVTFALMYQLKIEGRLRHVVGSLVVIDNLVEVTIFSVLLQLAMRRADASEAPSSHVSLAVLEEIILALLLGGGIYVILRILVTRRARSFEEEEDKEAQEEEAFLERFLAEHPSPSIDIFLIVLGAVSLGIGLAYFFHLPFLITATFAGFLIANFHSHAIFDSAKIDNIMPLFNVVFFALIGANMDLSGLVGGAFGLVALYTVTRFVGKYYGTWLGCKIVQEERKVVACLPQLMLPQAGVAAVEAVYAAAILGRPEITAIVLPSIVFFEIVGVFMVDRGLKRWRSWVSGEEEEMRRKTTDGPQDAAARLLRFLSPEFVSVHLKGRTKKEIVAELVDHARRASKQHIDRDQALQVLGERERLAATGFGNGVAIPHCRLLGLERPVLFFGKHEEAIAFGGVDNTPSDLFLLMLTCARDPGEHLKLISAAAHILGNPDIRNELRQAESPEDVISTLKRLAGDHEDTGG